MFKHLIRNCLYKTDMKLRGVRVDTVCPGSSDPPGKLFNIYASENEVYTIF